MKHLDKSKKLKEIKDLIAKINEWIKLLEHNVEIKNMERANKIYRLIRTLILELKILLREYIAEDKGRL